MRKRGLELGQIVWLNALPVTVKEIGGPFDRMILIEHENGDLERVSVQRLKKYESGAKRND